MTDFDDFKDDLAIVGYTEKPKKKVVKEVNYSEVTASGYCSKCHKRYTAAPVINGSVVCPNCNK
tara:strand:+ start:116 stop:307 length:192 start_codon:yes stop_codon:yes gene_type:complete